ncbi:alpha-2-macroglobulin [Luteimonas sp. M1R5S59]|uniref:Alpha-2-macroglobulin n=1 Tax=Luteimonas kalidii TaxID=3042025 RepID=A0ABT6JTL0_9GAMM|nr:alpha-2-macroglobulin [Luteimonas kalidii]MDH5833818.1 alpha-2-macroglobulin [Luteimonas kalidii]
MGVALLATALLAASGCRRNESGQLPGVSGEAIRGERDAIEGFGLVRAFPDQSEDGLAIALEFSQPLVGTQAFDRLVTFAEPVAEPSGWTLSDDGTVLRYPHVDADAHYTVRISAELTAADGSRLGQAREEKVYTGELDAVVGFASQGSVLPAKESRGLPVVSVNVEEVDVEFLRVKESSLPAFFAEYQRGGRRGSWELDSRWGDKVPMSKLAEPVYVNRFVLGGERNERVLTYLPLQDITELQQPGLYFAVMKKAGSFQDQFETAFFTVSDIGLHARAYRDTLFVHTASLREGDAVGSVELRVLDARGETIYRGATDGNGNAMLDYTLDAAHVLVASRGNDVSMLPFNQPALDMSEFAVSGRENAWFDVYAWSGRDLYRPGETVRVSALLRDHDGRPVAAKDGKAQSLFVRLLQPDGKTFFETRLQPGALGYFGFEKEVPVDAPTGRWQVEFRTDPSSSDAVQGMTLRIEEFLPERMKLDLASPAAVLEPGKPLALEATGAYLYGAPAAGNRFTAKLAVAVEQHPLEGMPGWFFGDPMVQLPKEAKDVVDATLDEQGRLRQDIALPEEVKATTPVAALVSGSLYESGGRTVNRTLKRVLWPAPALVAVRPQFDDEDGTDADSNPGFELLRVGADGKPRPLAGLQVTLVREHRDYHWRYDEDGGWDYEYSSRFENVETRTVDLGETAARINVPVEWGEYRLDVLDPETKLVTRYPFRAGWGWGDENRGLDARPDKVKLSLDRTRYRAGDTLAVTVTPPHAGKGLLMVESDRMLYVQEIDARAGSRFEIPVTEDWERHDVYVTALVFRGGSASSKVTPARAVGVAHVPMDRRERRIAVGLRAPEKIRPEGPMQVVLSAPQLAGKEAYATVSAVDVGILNITRYPVPDARAHFFAQRRLDVDAYDVYGRVVESFDGGTARLRFGGDMALAALPQARRPTARVQTVDLFSGPVKLDARGNAKVTVQVPDFNGTLRVSALVYSADSYGSRSVETISRAPIVAEASMPRVMAPGDRATVTLDLTNFTGRAGEFDVRVDGVGPVAIGEGARKLPLAVDGKSTLSFPLQAGTGYTVARVRVRVDGNGAKVDRSYDLPVRAAWPAVLRSSSRVLQSPAPVTLDATLADGLMPGSVTAQFTVSAIPPIPFASAIRGALDYPYGCAEQTTSKGYAALQLDQATVDMLGIRDVDASKRRQYVEGAFGRLASMQIGSGHFSMWGNDADVNPALTPYIVEFLLDARDAGFNVPETMLQKALERLSEDLLAGGNEFYGRDHRSHLKFAYQAHAGYVLARVNRAPLGTLRALYDNERKSTLTALPLVHLGLALSLQGDKPRGGKALDAAFAFEGDRPGYLWDYGSALRDASLMVALTHERGQARATWDAKAVDIGRELDTRRNRGRLYLSTQEQIALARLGKALAAAQGRQVSGTLTEGGVAQDVPAARVVGRTYDAGALAKGVRFDPDEPSQGEAGPLFVNIDVAGVPADPPAVDASRIKVERALFTTEGKPWTPAPLKEGEALIVAVAITSDVAMPDALLTDLLPAGLEIENLNLGDARQWADVVVDGIDITERSDAADVKHEEFRDDRYVAALSLDPGRKARVFYLVRAVTPGTYTVPPPMAEDMYRPAIRGVGRAVPATITVVQP